MKDRKEFDILIIEDNLGDYVLIEEFLNNQILNPKLSRAKSFSEAESLFKKNQSYYDIVLLDLSLPDNTGESLILDIIRLANNIPIIVLTGYTDFDFSVKSLSLGISDYLLKDELNAISLYKSIIYSIERRKNLFQIKESEKRYSDLFHLSPQPMYVFDLETLEFLDVNMSAINHYGYSESEFQTMKITEIRPPEEIPKLLELINNIKVEGNYSGTAIHKKKNGEVIKVEIQSNEINYKNRKAEVVLVNDITEKLNYLNAIESQNEKLREIAWIQSHIVRAPVARILGLIELMKMNGNYDTTNQEYFEYVIQSAIELDNIIRDINEKAESTNLIK
jgi:PAS domain S-box-containing protein